MKETRHPHPHIDSRQPRDGSRPQTNPPVFAWRPRKQDADFALTVARDREFESPCIELTGLRDPLFLPDTALAPGTYWWKWSAGGEESETFRFEVPADAVVLEVPQVSKWLERFPSSHPRIYVRREGLAALRGPQTGAAGELRADLSRTVQALLHEPHVLAEPDYLPDRRKNYQAFYEAFATTLWRCRDFVAGAETLALAYLLDGDERCVRAARERIVSVCRWDPEGSSYLGHNDEAHMAVIWHGSKVCDWVWDRFTDEERELVIEAFRRRGRITYEHMHDRGAYGVTRFDSHAGREIVFLALLGLVFHEQIPEAQDWLEWLRPVLCGIWPIWAGDDGGWAEGPSYGLAYVQIMTMFATALKVGAGVDLYRRPFWRGHARWRQCCLPPYAEWIGFGDHSERWRYSWERNADLVDLIGRQTGTAEFAAYVEAFRREAKTCPQRPGRSQVAVNSERFFLPPAPDTSAQAAGQQKVLAVFPGAGWAAIRTAPEEPDRDVAFIFRSSPYGAVSHSHANNNDFILHVGGKVMVMPSGYYAGYGSPHHAHWVWHSKSHNCVTLSGAGQLMRSHDSAGRILTPFEDDRVAYLCGDADASYADRALRCRRHVLFLKPHNCFALIDEFVARPGVSSSVQWNLHSWAAFEADEEARSFRVEREGRSLTGHFLYHQNSFFALSSGWDPPPKTFRENPQWHMQHHLRFTPAVYADTLNLAVVLCPAHANLTPSTVETAAEDGAEIARIGDDTALRVNPSGAIQRDGPASQTLAVLETGGVGYEVSDDGIRPV